MSGRIQTDRLANLAARLAERDLAVVRDVAMLRFVTAGQLARLHFVSIPEPVTRVRRVQRTLGRLVDQGLLVRSGRRVGGVRAGSSGFTYASTAESERLVRYLAGQGIPRARNPIEPGVTFVDHAVAVSEVYVQVIEAERAGRVELLDWQGEPSCWRRFVGPGGGEIRLRPDAFVALVVGDLEHRSFIEVDRGTEGSSALRRKLAMYVAYWRSGAEQQAHDVFPRVVWQVEHDRRAEVLRGLIAELPATAQRLFATSRPNAIVEILAGEPEQGGGS